MIKRGITLAIILVISLIQIVSASLSISPNPMDITTKINTPTNFTLTLTNTFPFNIENFKFENITGITFPNITLVPNETRAISIYINKNQLESKTYNSKVTFTYLVDIPASAQTHSINVTESGFNPDFISIHQGDTITWKNNGNLSHTVTGSTYDDELAPGETFSHTFNTIGTETYQDLNLFWGGQILVLSKTSAEEVHNPNYDISATINLNIISEATTLLNSFEDTSFEVKVTESSESMIIVNNTGNEIANKVTLSSSSSWISFNENNIDIDKGKKKYFAFKVQPIVYYTNQTNKTYTIPIEIKGLNTPSYNHTISVFIPYGDIDSNPADPTYLIKIIESFCAGNPNNAFCNTSVLYRNGNTIVLDPSIPVNLTASQFYSWIQKSQLTSDAVTRTDNKITSLIDYIETTEKNQSDSLAKLAKDVGNLKDEQETRSAIFWIAGIFLTLIGGFVISFKKIAKYKRKKYLMEN